MKDLIKICTNIYIFSGSLTIPKRFYQYIKFNEKMFIEKEEKTRKSINGNNIKQFIHTIELYALVVPEYHRELLTCIGDWA